MFGRLCRSHNPLFRVISGGSTNEGHEAEKFSFLVRYRVPKLDPVGEHRAGQGGSTLGPVPWLVKVGTGKNLFTPAIEDAQVVAVQVHPIAQGKPEVVVAIAVGSERIGDEVAELVRLEVGDDGVRPEEADVDAVQ